MVIVFNNEVRFFTYRCIVLLGKTSGVSFEGTGLDVALLTGLQNSDAMLHDVITPEVRT